MKKNLLLVIFLFLFSTLVFASSNPEPEIIINSQPDSPLHLSNPVAKWRNAKGVDGKELYMLTIIVAGKNISQKTISAYAIRVIDGMISTTSSYPTSSRALLQPDQQISIDFGEEGFDIQRTKPIIIDVDFVEFTDGTIWGADTSNSADQLAGIRAGAKAGQEYLERINQQKGLNAVIAAADEIKTISPSIDQNNQWKKGFRIGLNNLSYRLKVVYKKDGIKAVEMELRKALLFPR